MNTIQRPARVFRFGTTELPDPSPDGSMPVEEVRTHWAQNFPHLTMATISDPVLEGERLVYTFEAPEAKTKGGILQRLCSCKPFCETHGRDYVVEDAYDFGGEGCAECAADGFSGELCWPDADSCDLGQPKANRWERQFMCWWHRLQHWWFCWWLWRSA